MAESNVIFGRKLLKKFILLYKELPCLWDRSSLMYRHRKKRHDAVTKLTELVQQYDRSATKLHVLRKIESMRACVRRAHRRVVQSRVQATNPDEIYTPNLWYYNLLSFVLGEGGTDENKDSTEPDLEEEEENQNQKQEEENLEEEYDQEYALPTNVIEENLIQKYNFDEEEKSKRLCTEVEDEYDAIGINVAAKLRGLPPHMRILAEKLINDVLYQAQTNTLASNTVITSPDPIK